MSDTFQLLLVGVKFEEVSCMASLSVSLSNPNPMPYANSSSTYLLYIDEKALLSPFRNENNRIGSSSCSPILLT